MHIEKPCRVEHTYKQRLLADPQAVFPLLCPVREIEWAKGWSPLSVISTTGVAEEGCIFTTEDQGAEAIWLITRRDAEAGKVAFVKMTPGRVVTEINIQLRGLDKDQTEATVSYRYTAISEAGKNYIAERTADWYIEFMQEWESELNEYLGEKKKAR